MLHLRWFSRQVFLSSCYEVGAGLEFDFKKEDYFTNKWKFKEILDCHYSTPIEFKNYLYGFHGRQERGSLLRVSEYQMEKLCGRHLHLELDI